MKKFQRPAIGTISGTRSASEFSRSNIPQTEKSGRPKGYFMLRSIALSAVTLSAVCLGTVTVASEARADSRDDTFYDLLTMEGLDCESKYFNCPDGPGDLVAIGQAACGEMMRGASKSETVAKLGEIKASMSRKQVLTFVNIAAAVYCPTYL